MKDLQPEVLHAAVAMACEGELFPNIPPLETELNDRSRPVLRQPYGLEGTEVKFKLPAEVIQAVDAAREFMETSYRKEAISRTSLVIEGLRLVVAVHVLGDMMTTFEKFSPGSGHRSAQRYLKVALKSPESGLQA